MWLRDSAAQVEPYLRFAVDDPQIHRMLAGVVRRHAAQIAIDPYANAFNESASGARVHEDRPVQGPWVWERKYELDSLCYPIRLAHRLWELTASVEHLDDAVHRMLASIVSVMRTEQRHEASSPYPLRALRRPPAAHRNAGPRRPRRAVRRDRHGVVGIPAER